MQSKIKKIFLVKHQWPSALSVRLESRIMENSLKNLIDF